MTGLQRRALPSPALVAAILLAALAACECAPADDDPRPNILWISAEDLSPDLGCYGDAYARTPTLDRLAAQGMRFQNAFTHAGVCAPSRSGIITGMYPTTIGTHHMRSQGVPPDHVKCFTEYLRAAGYYCTNNSKTDYNFDSPPTAWDENSNKAHWRNRPKGAPFFAVINLTTTHEAQIRAGEKQFAAHMRRVKSEDRHDPGKAVLPPYYPDTPLVRRDWANYYDLITSMDAQVAEILQQLEDDGLAKNTIVFFWGDHGRGLPRGKRWLYDSGIRVPLMVRWPGKIEPGTVEEELVCLLDLAPTMLALAGAPIPEHLQGQVFLGPKKAPPRQYIYGARDRMDETYDIIRAVRDKQFKYIKNYQACKPYAQHIAYGELMPTMQELRRLHKNRFVKGATEMLTGPQTLFFRESKPEEELYDVTADPHEINNLADDPQYAKVLERMRAAHEAWTKETGDLGHIPEPDLKERMRPGGKWAVTAEPIAKVAGGKLTLSCDTAGASLAYRYAREKPGRWLLYSEPVAVKSGDQLEVLACRLGYRDSKMVAVQVP